MSTDSYGAAEKFILSREFFGMKLGLDNIKLFLNHLGQPQNNYLTIHISGTNGKGSTAAMLESILRCQGYKTGLFTSPHLITLRERIKVEGRNIPRRSVSAFIKKNRKLLSKNKLSFFELITAMALNHFSNVGVEVAIIETGLGGRLDASNVLKPILTITTDISLDHMEILGRSLKKIAYEKAGIIKEDTPHLIGLLPVSTVEVFEETCRKKNSNLHKLQTKDFTPNLSKNSISFSYNGIKSKNINLSLLGSHQLKNSALVMKAASILKQQGLKLNKSSIVNGLQNTIWPGRFQVVNYSNKPTHIFDVSHNVAGTKAFVESFQTFFQGKKAHILTGFVKRKEHKKIFNQLNKIAKSYSVIPLSTRRSTDINELLNSVDFKDIPNKKFSRLKTAYSQLLKKSQEDDIIIIIGSHYLVGEFFEANGIK
jgi:dihydrofolate synthase/folylpolyglutamate synthase